jgi:RNA polymerase sigma factor (sigma-70 family)
MDRAMEPDPDAELVMRTGRGDRAAAQALMARHLPKMLALARRMLAGRDEAEAEDAVQEAFLKVWRHAGRWRPGKAKFETWLYRVVLNQCYDRLRRKPTANLETAAEVADGAPLPGSGLEAAERASAVTAALNRLPERQKAALLLCHFEEMSNIKAAEAMGLSVEAMESLLSRGRRTLRAMLSDLKEG